MNFIVKREPRFHLIITDVFSALVNQAILLEAIDNEPHYQWATTGEGHEFERRRNKACSYDQLYRGRREESVLLSSVNLLLSRGGKFEDVLRSSRYPFTEFRGLAPTETQVSRYGLDGEKYDWHIDHLRGGDR